MDVERLKANYRDVSSRAAAAAERAGRPEGSWRLVAVTKSVGADVAAALARLGVGNLGENRVRELVAKREALAGQAVCWHMIGHLQRNKVKNVLGHVELIHSVDSLRLAREIEKVASRREMVQDVLLEVNVAGEEAKWGLTPEETPLLAEAVRQLPHVGVRGLMTMAPLAGEAEETRPVFKSLRQLGEQMGAGGLFSGSDWELSMGMTQDFEVAVEEGATLIRVGSALFAGV